MCAEQVNSAAAISSERLAGDAAQGSRIKPEGRGTVANGKTPNIVVIWGGDIGTSNLGSH
jgi:hypothetical protein